MVENVITDTINVVKDSASSGSPSSWFSGSGLAIGLGVLFGILIISAVIAILWFFWRESKQWTIKTRVHYENPSINGVSLGTEVPTKRVRFADGRVVYMYKIPIQGYTISPELLTWSKPKEHDVIITADKKVFCIEGINSIDIERKKLNVDVSYPDIEMDRQDLQHHIDSKKYDDPNDKLKTIAKAIIWVFVCVTVIVVVVLAGKYYSESNARALERDQINKQISSEQLKVMENTATMTALMKEIVPDLIRLKGSSNIGVIKTPGTT